MKTTISVLLCIFFLTFNSFTLVQKSSNTYDAQIEGTNYYFNSSDLRYTEDGDIDENPVNGYDVGRQAFISIEFGPGTGERCNFVIMINGVPHAVAGKKKPGGPDWVITP